MNVASMTQSGQTLITEIDNDSPIEKVAEELSLRWVVRTDAHHTESLDSRGCKAPGVEIEHFARDLFSGLSREKLDDLCDIFGLEYGNRKRVQATHELLNSLPGRILRGKRRDE